MEEFGFLLRSLLAFRRVLGLIRVLSQPFAVSITILPWYSCPLPLPFLKFLSNMSSVVYSSDASGMLACASVLRIVFKVTVSISFIGYSIDDLCDLLLFFQCKFAPEFSRKVTVCDSEFVSDLPQQNTVQLRILANILVFQKAPS